MFNLGAGEVLVVLLLALIVLGPQRLPDAAKQVGRFMGEMRKLSTGFQNELKTAFDDQTEAAARQRGAAVTTPPPAPTAAANGCIDDPPPNAPPARPARSQPLRSTTVTPAPKKPAPKKTAGAAKSFGATKKAAAPAKRRTR